MRSPYWNYLKTLLLWTLFSGLAMPGLAGTLYQVMPGPQGVIYSPASSYEDDRIPLIALHGLNNTTQSTEIKALTDALSQDPRMTAYFRVFTYGYDTFAGIDSNGQSFAQLLAQTFKDRRFVLIGYSMGGLVARSALELHGQETNGSNLMAQCLRLITLGTPHHGTPLANAVWLRLVEQQYPLLTLIEAGAKQYAGLSLSAEGVKDLAWDDFDGRTPTLARGSISSFLRRLDEAFAAQTQAVSEKYVFFGGYSTTWPNSLSEIFNAPSDKTAQYRTLGYVLGKWMASGDAYLASDGIVPLASSLYLTAPVPGSSNEPVGITVNAETTPTKNEYEVGLKPGAVEARKPPVRSVEVVADALHFQYPVHAEVYEKTISQLRLSEMCSGDLSGDGQVSVLDAYLSLRIAVGVQAGRVEDLLIADCDRDGRITIADTIHILRRAVGLE